VLPRRNAAQSNQALGDRTNESRAMPAVLAIAVASGRHSRRTANQSRPIPGVTLVRIPNAQAAG
jgi:hypothetical protein